MLSASVELNPESYTDPLTLRVLFVDQENDHIVAATRVIDLFMSSRKSNRNPNAPLDQVAAVEISGLVKATDSGAGKRKTLGALLSAESFIAAELEVRRKSYLPNPTKDEAEDIEDAEEVLVLVRAAMNGE